MFQGLEYIRNRLAADNVVEREETEAKEDEVSANKFFKTKKKSLKDVLELYLSSDNDDFDIFKERCACLRKLALELNTPLPASAACERLFSTGGLILRPHQRSLSDKHFETCLLSKLNSKFLK